MSTDDPDDDLDRRQLHDLQRASIARREADEEARANEIVVAGAIWMVLMKAGDWPSGLTAVERVDIDGQATNELLVSFEFMKSKYRIRVELTDLEASPIG